MSRVAKNPVPIPSGVEIKVQEKIISVSGSKGKSEFILPESVSVVHADDVVTVSYDESSSESTALAGTSRSLINNMVIGVVEGFSKKIELKGVGFRAVLKGNVLDIALGKSHPCEVEIPEGITLTIKENTKLTVEGADKQVVGEITATIYAFYPAEPYKGKGVHIVGKYVRRKEGKKSA